MTRVTARFSFGQDVGQNFGTLFEATTEDGRFTIGAGFLGACNTMMRADRYAVQFYVRPASGEREFVTEKLPRPHTVAGAYMFDLDGKLYTRDEGTSEVRCWDPDEEKWVVAGSARTDTMRIGNALVEYGADTIQVNGDPILPEPEQGRFVRPYYAAGHWLLYQQYAGSGSGYRLYESDDKGFSKLWACPWKLSDNAPIDLSRATVLTLKVVGEVPFTWGQLGDKVFACSNIGGVYIFDGESWSTVREPELNRSFQLYGALNFEDRLLLTQYPSGEIFEFDGEELRQIEGWPPRMPGVSASSREAQTATIYAGDLMVGVWPWGELWRYNPASGTWHFMSRMFEHPPITEKTIHPYENETQALGGVANQWGQRVTSLVPMGGDLMVSTSAKWPCKWEPKFDFITEESLAEYGSVTRLSMPGHLSVPLQWSPEPIELCFEISADEMRILRAGELLASAQLPPDVARAVTSGEMKANADGAGVFGAFAGETLKVTVGE